MLASQRESDGQNPPTLLDSMNLLLSTNDKDSATGQRGVMPLDHISPFTAQVLIHGLMLAIKQDIGQVLGNFGSFSRNTNSESYKKSLSRWLGCFNQLSFIDRCGEMGRSAFITYHIAHIMLCADLSNLLIAAGACRVMRREGSVAYDRRKFIWAAKSARPGLDAYRNALEVVAMSLVGRVSNPHVGFLSAGDRQKSLSPLCTAFTGYIGALVLCAFRITTSDDKPSRQRDHYISNLINRGVASLVSPSQTGAGRKQEENWFRDLLNAEYNMTTNQESQPDYRVQGIQRMVRLVQNRLSDSRWEIGKSLIFVDRTKERSNGLM